MKRLAAALVLMVFLFASFHVSGNIRLPAIIGSHMVLQQNMKITIWGWCDAGEKIKLKNGWDTTTYTATGSSSAKFSITLKSPVAGGPFQIMLEGNNKIVLEDVMVGEVWLCSGQSNMEMSVNWGLPYQEDVTNATDTKIRFFHIPRTTAEFPQEDLKAQWVVCNPTDMKQFSAAGYFFGKKLRQDLNLPIGLINASWGGTPAEVWTPGDLINGDPVLREAASKLTPSAGWPVSPALNYNGMIHPITKFAIAGAIWYQGEANISAASTYTRLLSTMITAWRKAWQQEFPFYLVEIAPYAGYGDNNSSAFLREAETKTLLTPKTGMIVVTDLVDNINDIHPKLKKEVGERLANYALAETYGQKDVPHKSPEYKSMKIEKGAIRIEFDNASQGLMSKGDTLSEFLIAASDQVFMPAKAKIDGNTVVVWSDEIKKPAAVRFAFSNGPRPNLFSKEGLPVDPFRTDDWAK